jgi:hypothetical protein
MTKDGALENRPCPACWRGVLYNTGVRQRGRPHHLFFQCSYCGKTMTAEKYDFYSDRMKVMSGRKGVSYVSKSSRQVGQPNWPASAGKSRQPPKPRVQAPKPGFVVGVVKDSKTGRPIEMAHICLKGRSIEAFTNKYGQYALAPIPEHKEVQIEFTSPGHSTKTHIYGHGVGAGEVKKLDMSLRPVREIEKPGALSSTISSLITISGGKVSEITRSGLEGVVKGSDGEPIFGALITVFHHERTIIVQTDTLGHYELIGVLPLGDYMVRAAAYGYSFDRKWARVQKGKVVRCDFTLSEKRGSRAAF